MARSREGVFCHTIRSPEIMFAELSSARALARAPPLETSAATECGVSIDATRKIVGGFSPQARELRRLSVSCATYFWFNPPAFFIFFLLGDAAPPIAPAGRERESRQKRAREGLGAGVYLLYPLLTSDMYRLADSMQFTGEVHYVAPIAPSFARNTWVNYTHTLFFWRPFVCISRVACMML